MIEEWTGLITGQVGTYLLTLDVKYHKYGWGLLILAAISWLSVGIMTNMHGLMVTQTCYAILSIRGAWNTRRA